MDKDFYKILGLVKGTSLIDIKEAYRKLAMVHHPDRGGNEEKMKEINRAYAGLIDILKQNSFGESKTSDKKNTSTGKEEQENKNYSQYQEKGKGTIDRIIYKDIDFKDFLEGTKIWIEEANIFLEIPPKTKPWTIFRIDNIKYFGIYFVLVRIKDNGEYVLYSAYPYPLKEFYATDMNIQKIKSLDIKKFYRYCENLFMREYYLSHRDGWLKSVFLQIKKDSLFIGFLIFNIVSGFILFIGQEQVVYWILIYPMMFVLFLYLVIGFKMAQLNERLKLQEEDYQNYLMKREFWMKYKTEMSIVF